MSIIYDLFKGVFCNLWNVRGQKYKEVRFNNNNGGIDVCKVGCGYKSIIHYESSGIVKVKPDNGQIQTYSFNKVSKLIS